MESERKERITLIDKATDLLRVSVDQLATSLALFLTGFFTSKLILEDGNIQDSKENYETINHLEEAKASFFDESVVPFLAGISLVFFQITEKNKEYFREAEKESGKEIDPPVIVDTSDCVNGVEETVRSEFGFNITDDSIEIEPTGWLANIGDLKSTYDKVRESAMKAVGARMPLIEFLKILKREIQGDEQFTGLVQNHFKTIIWDVYAEFDRQVGYKTAVCLGYRAAIYEGGLIDRSRDFCIERNGKVFTYDEIRKFGTSEDEFGGYTDKATGQFDGKPKFDYDPFFDQGGHNCRHAYSFIPDRLAIRLRPELKEVFNA